MAKFKAGDLIKFTDTPEIYFILKILYDNKGNALWYSYEQLNDRIKDMLPVQHMDDNCIIATEVA